MESPLVNVVRFTVVFPPGSVSPTVSRTGSGKGVQTSPRVGEVGPGVSLGRGRGRGVSPGRDRRGSSRNTSCRREDPTVSLRTPN